ncbi:MULTISPECIES: hypothetical protein [unclassified Sphingomonas]|jgi:hypothetical protein|uniref:hypothetical protein n=1 Tax=unclassified Sphingomonas TaxID=196159 RepID=UPI00082BE886|nr:MULTISPECIES: hypothetical protein [unclassified Sphingomonas]MCH4891991.1 hypothetical protein [Sphingomonas sp. SFZ2018-12]
MANVDGNWDTVAKTPMGDQKATLSVASSGDTFTGTYSGAMGTTEIKDGKVDGNNLTWKVDIVVPMPMTLDCSATVDGDTITGSVGAGAFGSFPLSGTRAA